MFCICVDPCLGLCLCLGVGFAFALPWPRRSPLLLLLRLLLLRLLVLLSHWCLAPLLCLLHLHVRAPLLLYFFILFDLYFIIRLIIMSWFLRCCIDFACALTIHNIYNNFCSWPRPSGALQKHCDQQWLIFVCYIMH